MIFVFYFFRLRPALAHMALVAVATRSCSPLEDTGRTQVDGWLAAVGTLAIGGFVVALLRDRLSEPSSASPSSPPATRSPSF